MGLFDKFARVPQQAHETDADVRSIVENLNNILNTRRGYGSIVEDLGIRDFSEISSRDHIANAIIAEVEQNIERFEPRVRLVGITRVDDDNPLRLSFRIDCTLRETSRALSMVFDSVNSQFSLDPV